MKIGDKIRDVEDGDCYYEGVIVELNPVKYKISNVVWCGEVDDSMNGNVTELKWWKVELYKNSEWVIVND